MRMLKHAIAGLVTLVVWTVGAQAQGQPAATPAAAPAAAPKVKITSPQANAVVAGTSVHVTLAATGIEIAPAAEHKPGTAHHHLFLDVDVSPADAPIPMGAKGIVHLGKGQTEFTFDSVAAGAHRLIAVLADPNHVILKPVVADTVRFTVKP